MILSHSHNFIFIHVYKVAGTSISDALAPYNIKSLYMYRPYRYLSRVYPQILPNPYPRHAKAIELKERLPKEVFNHYFKFGFVRNPWDWQVSLYKYPLKKKNHHQRKLINDLGSFENYLKWRIEHEVRLQKDFLYDGSNKLVDFIGKIENLQEDFDLICEKIGIEKIKLPHLNKSNDKSYREFYNDKTKDLLYKAYKDDIELLGYEF